MPITKLPQSQPPGVSLDMHSCTLQLHIITALQCISKFSRSQCGDAVERDGRQPTINTRPHIAWHSQRHLEYLGFRLQECRMKVRAYKWIPGHNKLHTLDRSMNTLQGCVSNPTKCVYLWPLCQSTWNATLGKIEFVKPRVWKDRVCILCNAMISTYPGVSQMYTPCC